MTDTLKDTKKGIAIVLAFLCFVVAFGVSGFEKLNDAWHVLWVWGLSLIGFVALSLVLYEKISWRILAVCLAITTVIAVDLSFSHCVNVWDNAKKGTWYCDSYRRFGKQFYREMHTDDYSTRGPTAESGSPHGMWVTTYNDRLESQKDWYFYGEKVTEAEWHLRENR